MTHLARYALSALLLCLLAASRANACTAIVVGKKASATGHVLVGHNEDGSKAFMRYAMLPRRGILTETTKSPGHSTTSTAYSSPPTTAA